MQQVREKIRKPAGKKITEFEEKVANEIYNLVNSQSNEDIKGQLDEIWFAGATPLKLKDSGKEAILLYLPYRLLSKYRPVQVRLVRELEKKFSGHHVVVIALRTVLPERSRGVKRTAPRPRSRTLTAVQDANLEDLVQPGEIVGKRLRVKQDGSKTLHVLLDPKDQNTLESKCETFESVYRFLTGKAPNFSFQTSE
jgi:small subunit ribosomal protein S7e